MHFTPSNGNTCKVLPMMEKYTSCRFLFFFFFEKRCILLMQVDAVDGRSHCEDEWTTLAWHPGWMDGPAVLRHYGKCWGWMTNLLCHCGFWDRRDKYNLESLQKQWQRQWFLQILVGKGLCGASLQVFVPITIFSSNGRTILLVDFFIFFFHHKTGWKIITQQSFFPGTSCCRCWESVSCTLFIFRRFGTTSFG